ncbi:HEAT repeat domain-containing protein [Nannocystis pusilla]|uniref:HEAT repeat domain-containing protein n=1 Tax=Nannocystis pusilla TaxID=889268 RepID=UPI003B7E7926
MRNKLLIAAVIANLAGMIAAVFLARLIRDVPADASTETMLLVAYYTAMCVVAVADALLVDEFMFGGVPPDPSAGQGPEVRPGERRGGDGGGDHAALVGQLPDRPVAVRRADVPALQLREPGLQLLLPKSWDSRQFSARRRTRESAPPAAGDRRAVGAPAPHDRADFAPAARPRGRGRGVGAWALGRFIDVTSERKAILGDLRAAAKSPDPNLRREALISLARYQDRDVADQLIGELERDLAANVIDRRLLIAAGYIQVPKLLPVLQQVLQRGDEKAQRVAAWAIAQHRDQREAKDLDTMLTDRLPSAGFPVRCAIVFSLGILGNERANVPLMHAYDTATPEERTTTCPVEVVYLRPDGQQDHFDLLLPVDNYENHIFKVLGQIRATSPEIRAEVEPWLERLVAAHKGDGTLKADRAQSLLDGIRSARDDSKLAAPE